MSTQHQAASGLEPIISMTKWTRTSRLSIKNLSLSAEAEQLARLGVRPVHQIISMFPKRTASTSCNTRFRHAQSRQLLRVCTQEGTRQKVVKTLTWKPWPKSGLDCLMCAMCTQAVHAKEITFRRLSSSNPEGCRPRHAQSCQLLRVYKERVLY